jgi:hypothetical protein
MHYDAYSLKRLNSVIPGYFFKVPGLNPAVISDPKGNSPTIIILIFDARVIFSYTS